MSPSLALTSHTDSNSQGGSRTETQRQVPIERIKKIVVLNSSSVVVSMGTLKIKCPLSYNKKNKQNFKLHESLSSYPQEIKEGLNTFLLCVCSCVHVPHNQRNFNCLRQRRI